MSSELVKDIPNSAVRRMFWESVEVNSLNALAWAWELNKRDGEPMRDVISGLAALKEPALIPGAETVLKVGRVRVNSMGLINHGFEGLYRDNEWGLVGFFTAIFISWVDFEDQNSLQCIQVIHQFMIDHLGSKAGVFNLEAIAMEVEDA